MSIIVSTATPGGGALPEEAIESVAIEFSTAGASPDQLHQLFRSQEPPVIGRISNGKFLIDMKTILDHQIPTLSKVVRTVLDSLSER